MLRSRRLLFVLSPDFLTEKSFSLLECRLGLYLQHGRQATIVAVSYRSVSKLPCVEAAHIRQAATSTMTWRGSGSEPRRSRFWLRLRLALPIRPLALGKRLIDSTSSHSDLGALVLQRELRHQNQTGANQNLRNKWTSASQRYRNRQTPPRGRGSSRRSGSCGDSTEAWPQRSRTRLVGAGFVDQVDETAAKLTVETETQQIQSDPTLNNNLADNGSVPHQASDSAPPSCQQDS